MSRFLFPLAFVCFLIAPALADDAPKKEKSAKATGKTAEKTPSQKLKEDPNDEDSLISLITAALEASDDAVLLVMPSDHVINDVAAFRTAIEAALPLARDGWLITFGITPDKPETGYGYIRRGAEIAGGVYKVEAFVEKPDLARAQSYLAAGDYSWNGGIFLFRADTYLAALERYQPLMVAAVRAALERGERGDGFIRPDAEAFLASPAESIDYAVMEKSDRVAVVPVEMGWSDVGSWDALHLLGPDDGEGNVIQGDVVAIDTRNCLIRSEGPVVTTVGVENLIIVATRDAVMVLPRGASQAVKQVVEALKAREHETLDVPF